MAQEPQYKREVTPQFTPEPYKDLKINSDIFGVNVSQAANNAGRGFLVIHSAFFANFKGAAVTAACFRAPFKSIHIIAHTSFEPFVS